MRKPCASREWPRADCRQRRFRSALGSFENAAVAASPTYPHRRVRSIGWNHAIRGQGLAALRALRSRSRGDASPARQMRFCWTACVCAMQRFLAADGLHERGAVHIGCDDIYIFNTSFINGYSHSAAGIKFHNMMGKAGQIIRMEKVFFWSRMNVQDL